jgi:predicted ATP-grasp superfamily ATP-dependent carboligase
MPEKPKIFVLEGNFLGLEMARELRDAGYQVTVIGHRKTDIALYARDIAGHVLPLPQEDRESLLKGLLEIGSGHTGPRVLMGASEGYRIWLAENRQSLSSMFNLVVGPPGEIKAISDKWAQLQMAALAGLSIPASAIMDDGGRPTRNIRFPAVVKPRYSQKTTGFRETLGSKVLLARNKRQLNQACRRLMSLGYDPLVQEMIPGADFSQFLFGAAVWDGKPCAICLAQKLKAEPSPFGSGVVVRTIRDNDLMEAGISVLSGTNYTGICDIEFMRNWDTGVLEFIEFNPRYGIGQRVAQKAGTGLAEAAVRMAMGDIPGEALVAKPGFYWVYFDEWARERVNPWRNTTLRSLRDRNNTATEFDARDCLPEALHVLKLLRLKLMHLTGR